MTTDRSVVQFVCFETSLPRQAFIPAWVPFANTFLAQGLRHSILSECITRRGAGPSFDFIARNEWPEEMFARAAQAGHIADVADDPVRAAQGETFRASGPVPYRAQFTCDKVIALLSIPNGDIVTPRRAISAASAPVPGAQLYLYGDDVADRRRFDIVTEVYGALGQGADLASRLETAIAGLVDPGASTIAVYLEVLTLPPPPPAL
jgi:hypothetical protein